MYIILSVIIHVLYANKLLMHHPNCQTPFTLGRSKLSRLQHAKNNPQQTSLRKPQHALKETHAMSKRWQGKTRAQVACQYCSTEKRGSNLSELSKNYFYPI